MWRVHRLCARVCRVMGPLDYFTLKCRPSFERLHDFLTAAGKSDIYAKFSVFKILCKSSRTLLMGQAVVCTMI